MPHFDADGREEWVCQKGAHVCTGRSTWVEQESEQATMLGCYGNVCSRCLEQAKKNTTQLYRLCVNLDGGGTIWIDEDFNESPKPIGKPMTLKVIGYLINEMQQAHNNQSYLVIPEWKAKRV